MEPTTVGELARSAQEHEHAKRAALVADLNRAVTFAAEWETTQAQPLEVAQPILTPDPLSPALYDLGLLAKHIAELPAPLFIAADKSLNVQAIQQRADSDSFKVRDGRLDMVSARAAFEKMVRSQADTDPTLPVKALAVYDEQVAKRRHPSLTRAQARRNWKRNAPVAERKAA